MRAAVPLIRPRASASRFFVWILASSVNKGLSPWKFNDAEEYRSFNGCFFPSMRLCKLYQSLQLIFCSGFELCGACYCLSRSDYPNRALPA